MIRPRGLLLDQVLLSALVLEVGLRLTLITRNELLP
jgi:hypothetical protein